ncbi:unnamed protein product, partial [Prorocentrum cordatum]
TSVGSSATAQTLGRPHKAQGALGALERRLLCRLEASERRFEAQRSAEGARQRAWRDGIAQRLAAVEQRLESVRGVGPLVEQVARVMPDVQRLQDSCDRVLADRAAFDSWQRRLAACEGAARRASDADRRVDELWALVEQTAGEQGRVLSECVGEVELGMSRLCAVEGSVQALSECVGEVELGMSRLCAVEDSVERLDHGWRAAWGRHRRRDQHDVDGLLEGLHRRLQEADARHQHEFERMRQHLQHRFADLAGRLPGAD